ncbi:hypothetical protein DSECCO2_55240 [anaerobic digester metagenome]
MKPEIKGKIVVSLVVSMLAFVVGTGAGILVGFSPINNTLQINNTTTSEFPALPYSTTNTVGNSADNNSVLDDSSNDLVYVENSKTNTQSTNSSTNSTRTNSS